MTRGYRGLQEVTRGYKGVERGYRGLQGVRGYYEWSKGVQGVTTTTTTTTTTNNNSFIYSALFNMLGDQKRIATINNLKTFNTNIRNIQIYLISKRY